MDPVEMRARLRAVLQKRPDELAPLWSNVQLRTQAAELIALDARPASAISQIAATTGICLTKDQFIALRERVLASPEHRLAQEPLLIAAATQSVTTESAALGPDAADDPRVQTLLDHAFERVNGLQRMYKHQMAFIDGYIERGAPIPRERLQDMLKTADSAATAATTAARLLEMAAPRISATTEAAVSGRAPCTLEERDGQTVLLIEPEPETKEMQVSEAGSVLPAWEPLLP